MADINIILLAGRLCADPELKFTQGKGTAVLTLNLAVDRPHLFGDKKKTDFFKVVFWNKAAEGLAEHATKGTKIWVRGYMSIKTYEDKEGNKKLDPEVNAEEFGYLSKSANYQEQESGQQNNGYSNEEDMQPVDIGDVPF